MIKQQKPQEQLKYVRLPLEMLDYEWATSADVVIYAFMLNRFMFFKELGNLYYENIEDIAKGSRQGIATVKRCIKKLQENGYIDISKIKVKTGQSNAYVVKDVHKLFNFTKIEQSDYEDLF